MPDREDRKRAEAERRKRDKTQRALSSRIADLEGRIAERERQIQDLEAAMSAQGFYDDRDVANASIARHQSLMWEVGDLMGQWEALQAELTGTPQEP